MKTITIALLTLSLTTICGEGVLAQSGNDLYQEALVKERVEGDLRGAIELYQRIASDFAGHRTLAANALVQMGLCYEKLGSEEAARAYQRVLQDYADQTEIVSRARERLAGLDRPQEEAEDASIVVRQIWGGSFGDGPAGGPDGSGGPSPDGRYLAYVDWRTGDLAVWDLAAGEGRRLTHDGSFDVADYQYPNEAHFSPDGNFIAYTWLLETVGTQELRVVDLDGSSPRILYKDPKWMGPFAWSNDGRWIATRREREEGVHEVFMVATVDGSVLPLREFEDEGFKIEPGGRLSFSPNDRYLALGLLADGDLDRGDIWLLATDGSGRAFPIVEHPADDQLVGWIPGTQTLLFQSDRSGSPDLWAAEVVDGQTQGLPRALRRNVGDPRHLGFTDDGRMFYAVFTHRFNTFIAPFDAEAGEVALEEAQALLGSFMHPRWSPTGRLLALIHQEWVQGPPPNLKESLVVRDVETGEERELASHIDLGYARLSWSPDERSILVHGYDWTRAGAEESEPSLWRVEVGSGEATAVLDTLVGRSFGYPSVGAVWTASGDGVIYANGGRVVLRDLESGREMEMYRDPRLAHRLIALSPDGRQLAFGVTDSEQYDPEDESVISGGGRILTIPAEGGEVRELATIRDPGLVRAIDWTPDGEYLLLGQNQEEGGVVFRIPRRGGELEELWAIGQTALGVHPDGNKIAYSYAENDLEIWVMENLVAVLKEGSGG
ncbi:MAG: DPP IV N-terminal domain-containing protein [Gemmatimonadota bacterium]|jgi:Tol biopolymer transport system component